MNTLQIYEVPIEELQTAEYNPRKWDNQAEKHLKQSLQKFGFVDPLIVNKANGRENILIGGHFRLSVSKKLGYKKVPVVFVNIPEIQKEKELNLRLNRNTGEWDMELLKDFDIDLLLDVGFNDQDLGEIWDNMLQTEDDNFDKEKALEEIKTPQAKLGDIYQLGRHRLICGNSTNPKVIEKLLEKKKVNMVYSDPPYNISLDYHKGVSGKKQYGGKQTNDSLSEEAYRDFLKQTMQNALLFAEDNLHMFYWCDENYVGLIQSLFKELGLTNRRTCLWIKNNFNLTPQVAFNKGYEPCCYATKKNPYLNPDSSKATEILNKEIEIGNRTIDDILDIFNIWLAKRLSGNQYQHPTEKPVTLHERPLRRCTKAGDIILDLFGGSGSTLIACEQMKRICYMVELEPIFVDLIISRYEKLTGEKSKKLN